MQGGRGRRREGERECEVEGGRERVREGGRVFGQGAALIFLRMCIFDGPYFIIIVCDEDAPAASCPQI